MRGISEAAESGLSPSIAALQLDLSKAFDRVNREYFFGLLRYCNVGHWMEECLRVFYANHATDRRFYRCIHQYRTLHQPRLPSFPVLFAFYLEPLSRMVSNNHRIRGRNLGALESKVLDLADDVPAIYSPRGEIGLVLEKVKTFSSFSDAELKQNKLIGRIMAGRLEGRTSASFPALPGLVPLKPISASGQTFVSRSPDR